MAKGLLLDIGGVVLRAGAHLVEGLADRDRRLRVVLDRFGGIGSDRDELWHRMLAREVSERAYWARRAAELGDAVGEEWSTRTMINKLYEGPQDEWLQDEVVALMADTKAAGLALGALTNDLADFHGEEWMSRQESWLRHFDVIVDASVTGVMKPDPAAFRAGAEALGLPPEDIVYLDDMPWNVEGGLAAGLQAVRVSYDEPEQAIDEARARLGLPPRAA
jgi:putative hydrolase of the HAD superfamily